MPIHNQIYIPESFITLFMEPRRHKPNAPYAEIAARYELCEDMASMLTETAKEMQFSLGITEQDVLGQCLNGLQAPGSVVSNAEAVWVIHRLAELLDWPRLESKPETDATND